MAESKSEPRPVRKLTVKNFSVIKDAELEFGKITVLIGPQASGKSLLCKLAYFFGRESINIAIDRVVNRFEYSEFESLLLLEFEKWFPKGGWGGEEWQITFTEKDFRLEISSKSKSQESKDISVTFGSSFREAYVAQQLDTVKEQQKSGFPPPVDVLRSLAATKFLGLCGRGIRDASTYIPLERAYFIEAAKGYRILGVDSDPISARFANVLTDSMNLEIARPRTNKYLDGKLFMGPDGWSWAFWDGRFLPLADLSSGSKETLPIWSVLDYYDQLRRNREVKSDELNGKKLYMFDDFFIEEPEASVFPKTQFDLVREFSGLSNESDFEPHFVITTHSPYILSAFGNLIKAGQVHQLRPDHAEALRNVIPQRYWIDSKDFGAYALKSVRVGAGRFQTESIFHRDTGDLNADYLDNVSSDIAEEFSHLLELQYGG